MSAKNYYQVLGIDRNASGEEIKNSYETLENIYRIVGKPEEDIKKLKEAYSTLSHPAKRKIYDLLLLFPRTKDFSFSPLFLNFRTATWPLRKSRKKIKERLPSKKKLMRMGLVFSIMFCFVVTLPYLLVNITANYHYKKAVKSYKEGMFNSALVNLNQSIYEFGRKNVDACLLSSKILIEQFHEYDYALQYVEKGLNYASEDTEKAALFFMKGKVMKLKGLHKDALEAFEISKDYHEENDSVYFEIGEIETFIFNNYHMGIKNYNISISLNKELEEAYLGRGYCYQQLQLHNKAIQDFENYIQFNELEGMGFFLKAVSEIEIDAKDDACNDLERASQLGITGAQQFLETYCNAIMADPLEEQEL
jgi:tetratricopeptide (TPR) repeat protein